mmetsp:Transcript_10185/g.20106  ORF Transcript_10185/g.20106 Transcript_10185/m.20106 type:complete len:238 (-) Transcript_10185:190-903(-)
MFHSSTRKYHAWPSIMLIHKLTDHFWRETRNHALWRNQWSSKPTIIRNTVQGFQQSCLRVILQILHILFHLGNLFLQLPHLKLWIQHRIRQYLQRLWYSSLGSINRIRHLLPGCRRHDIATNSLNLPHQTETCPMCCCLECHVLQQMGHTHTRRVFIDASTIHVQTKSRGGPRCIFTRNLDAIRKSTHLSTRSFSRNILMRHIHPRKRIRQRNLHPRTLPKQLTKKSNPAGRWASRR